MTEAGLPNTTPTPKTTPSPKRPKVLIVGAGLGGVVLGAFLEKAGVPYEIYERAAIVKPLGSAMAFGCNVMGIFRHLGIEKEFLEQAKLNVCLEVYSKEKELLLKYDYPLQEEKPIIYDMLLRLIPAQKLHFGKRVLSMNQGPHGVLIRTQDGHTHEGDILVGADGAYSGVRQSLYERLKKDNELPASDTEELPFRYVSLVGQTKPLDPEEYPELKVEDSPYQCVILDNGHTLTTFNTINNTILWNMVLILDKETKKSNDAFRNSEWGPEAAEQMCNEVKDFPILNGDGTKTLNDLIEMSPKRLISKVMLEEKVFKTWYSGRTVMLGDGAICAMQDAVVLANWINVIQVGESVEEVEKKFKEYKDERLPHVMQAYYHSKNNTNLTGTDFQAKLTRWIINHLPDSIMDKLSVANVRYRPIASFLPTPADTGSVKPSKQPSLTKTRMIMAQQGREVVAV
ncbi:hypothetical protein CPB97_001485 [Podila verticillata]|nr:hypothetical protein CPB97_001485 [Podila verticillata]